ncbi:protein kinase domain-containing protein [Agrilutibacter solisilvae]|uniref:Serine/threonine protein kinase n=1 Tax=Agrilutibacter solisilvae TaxID=2763317 RepID=A0A975ARR2_9GAMM|nr:protein kinase [Lysobacter solisilvae]QSX77513.1 serine/threonine protein kinase [Lysobacter solisilvae]
MSLRQIPLDPGGALLGRLFGRMLDEQSSQQATQEHHRAEVDAGLVGREVGPYLLLELIGSGGMGAVYRARHRTQKLDRDVALKLVRDRGAYLTVRERFLQERDILAQLHHPGIAQIYDAGETDDGILYFTMEYIDGVPITQYCKDYVDSVADRVRLLQRVVTALGSAHRNLVIHRDIKPSNVFVTRQGGEVKLLDFGIAKSLGGASDLTNEASPGPMTPLYAAPEQFHGRPLSVPTDIYQTGVLIFYVLTGNKPYRADPGSPIAWSRAVTEEEPLQLQQAFDMAARGGAKTGEPIWYTSAKVRAVRKQLRGDLNAIVRKALAKDPDQRYHSADALQTDLAAYLAGRPVVARHGGRLYRISRLLRRNLPATLIAAIASVVLTVVVTLGVTRVESERDLAVAAAKVATQEARRAELTRDFLLDLIARTDPTEPARGSVLSASDYLEWAARQVDSGLEGVPEARAQVRAAIAQSLEHLEGPARALPLHTKSVEELRRLDSPDARGVLPKLLATQATLLNSAGQTQEAEPVAREMLALTAGDPAWARDRISAMTALAHSLNKRGRSLESLQIRQQILVDRQALDSFDLADLAMDHQNIAVTEVALDRFADAERSYRQSLLMLERSVGAGNPRSVLPLNGLASTLTKLGRYEEAQAVAEQALSVAEASLAPGHFGIANALTQLGVATFNQGRYEEAQRLLAKAESVAGPDDPGKIRPYINLYRAELYLRWGRFLDAKKEAKLAASGMSKIRGPDSPMTLLARGMASYTAFKVAPKKNGESERILREVQSKLAQDSSSSAEEMVQLKPWLAEILESKGAKDEAKRVRIEALAMARRIYGDAHPLVQALREASQST